MESRNDTTVKRIDKSNKPAKWISMGNVDQSRSNRKPVNFGTIRLDDSQRGPVEELIWHPINPNRRVRKSTQTQMREGEWVMPVADNETILKSLSNTSEERSARRDEMTVRYPSTNSDLKYKHMEFILNNPDGQVETAPTCFEDRKDGSTMNSYGCISEKNEVCHADICTSLTDIDYKDMLVFLNSDSPEEVRGVYRYVQNSPTLVNIVEQILYLAFTPPQLVFIADHLQRTYTSTVSAVPTNDDEEAPPLDAVWIYREPVAEPSTDPIPESAAIGRLLIRDRYEYLNNAVQYSLWRSPFPPPDEDPTDPMAARVEAFKKRFELPECLKTMKEYI